MKGKFWLVFGLLTYVTGGGHLLLNMPVPAFSWQFWFMMIGIASLALWSYRNDMF